MLNDQSGIIAEVMVRLGTSTTVSSTGYTDTILNNWSNQAHRWAAAYHKWPFTSGRASTTYTSASEQWDFEGYKADSIRMAQIGGYELKKITWPDYLKFKENYPSDTDRVFANFGRSLFINTATGLSGTLTVYGQYIPPFMDITSADNTATVFSNWDDEGNDAIINEMLSYAKARERKAQEQQFYHAEAVRVLEEVWKRVMDEQHIPQTKDRGQWDRIDVLTGGTTTDEDQFNVIT